MKFSKIREGIVPIDEFDSDNYTFDKYDREDHVDMDEEKAFEEALNYHGSLNDEDIPDSEFYEDEWDDDEDMEFSDEDTPEDDDESWDDDEEEFSLEDDDIDEKDIMDESKVFQKIYKKTHMREMDIDLYQLEHKDGKKKPIVKDRKGKTFESKEDAEKFRDSLVSPEEWKVVKVGDNASA